jgi:hypothetical protein
MVALSQLFDSSSVNVSKTLVPSSERQRDGRGKIGVIVGRNGFNIKKIQIFYHPLSNCNDSITTGEEYLVMVES